MLRCRSESAESESDLGTRHIGTATTDIRDTTVITRAVTIATTVVTRIIERITTLAARTITLRIDLTSITSIRTAATNAERLERGEQAGLEPIQASFSFRRRALTCLGVYEKNPAGLLRILLVVYLMKSGSGD